MSLNTDFPLMHPRKHTWRLSQTLTSRRCSLQNATCFLCANESSETNRQWLGSICVGVQLPRPPGLIPRRSTAKPPSSASLLNCEPTSPGLFQENTPPSDPPPPDRPNFMVFFFPLQPPFSLFFPLSGDLLVSFFLSLEVFSCFFFSLSGGSSRGILVVFEAPGPSIAHVWALGLSRTTPEAFRAPTLQAPHASGPPLFPGLGPPLRAPTPQRRNAGMYLAQAPSRANCGRVPREPRLLRPGGSAESAVPMRLDCNALRERERYTTNTANCASSGGSSLLQVYCCSCVTRQPLHQDAHQLRQEATQLASSV